MKKLRFIIPLLFCLVLGLGISNASAASSVQIYINGEKQSFSNKAVMQNGTTLVPLRGIFEELGADVTWSQSKQTIDASNENTKIWLKIGSTTAKVNGKDVKLTTPAKVINGNTLVPLRFISESLGESVKWDNSTRSVIIGSGEIIDTKGTGNVKGTVIWKYNDYVGVKGDAGATVYLFSKNSTYPTYTKEQLFSWIDGNKDLKGVYQTKVDANGNYSFEDIPSGKYVGVISSKNTKRNFLDEELQPNTTLKSLIGDFNYDIFEANRLEFQKHIIKEIEVKVDKTEDFSTDFGYTYL